MEEYNYANDKSELLDEVRKAGFKPIAITSIACEETFVFKGLKESQLAWEKFKPEGYWYDLDSFTKYRIKYVKDFYNGNIDDAPLIYWLNDSFINNI